MIIIDGNMLAHRAFHKLDFLSNSAGTHTGMEYGFLRSVESLERKFPTEKIVICFDTKENNKRTEGGRYKANRSKMTSTFYERLSVLQSFVNCFWDISYLLGVEADEIMYSIALKQKENVYLYTNDNDLLQCVGDNISVLKSHESSLYVWDEDKVREKYGVEPRLLALFRSFVGDKSDNLDGVPRIQKKILSDAIYRAEDKGWKTPEEIAEFVIDYQGWSTNMLIKIHQFVRSGLWKENYELMHLVDCEYNYLKLQMDEDFVIEKLKYWEIGSLNLCKPYKELLVSKESEF